MDRVENIKMSVNIFDLMDKLHIDYPFRGTGQMHCPFHDDRNASARVYEDTNKIFCWVCGKAWDAVELLVDYSSLNFRDALTWLEKEFKIDPARCAQANFYRLGKSTVDPQEDLIKNIVADRFIDFYSVMNKTTIIWDSIFLCWQIFDSLPVVDAAIAMKWLSFSLAMVRDAFCVQFELNRYQPAV